jgi:hypothetical protein
MDMSFSIDDIQFKDEWRERAMNEAKQIHSKESTARNRSLNEIYEACLYGHAPEQYLIESGWEDDTRKYKDVIDPIGDLNEIKVTEHIGNVPYVLARCQAAKLETWREYPDIVYIFINDRKSKEYTHEGIYLWNGKKYKKA